MTKTRSRKGSANQGNNKSSTGSSLSKDTSSSSPDDDYHNHATPCSLILGQICVDMFPEIVNQPTNHENIQHSTNRSLTKLKPHQSEEKLTLDQVIRYYLLEKRRSEQVLLEQQRQLNQNTNKIDERTTISKKRKKKKKKKKDTEQQSIEDPSSLCLSPCTTELSECNIIEEEPKLKNSDLIDHIECPLPEKWNRRSLQELQIDAMLDDILLLQSKHKGCPSSTESSSIQENEPKEIIVSESRQLDSFLQYLHQRFDKYYEQQSTCKKTKGTRSHPPSNKHIATTATTTTQSSTNHIDSTDGTLLNDIEFNGSVYCDSIDSPILCPEELVPTINMSDISSTFNRIKCSACKKAAIEYIRTLTTRLNPGVTTNGNSINTSPTSSSSSTPSSSTNKSSSTILTTIKVPDRYTTTDNDDWMHHNHNNTTIVDPISRDYCIIDSASVQVYDDTWKRGLQEPVSIWTASNNEDYMDEPALDYTALEEGCMNGTFHNDVISSLNHHPERSNNDDSFRLVLRLFTLNESNNGKILQLVPPSSNAKKDPSLISPPSPTGNNNALKIFPMSLTDFDKWIRTVIIPCGLKALDKYKDDAKLLASNIVVDPCLSKTDFYMLAKKVESLCIFFGERFLTLDQTLETARSMIQQAACDINLGPICTSVSKTLETVDAQCMDYFLMVDKFIFSLHQETMDACIVPNGYKSWIEDIMKELWGAFDDAIYQMIPIITDYLRKLLNLPCRIGSIPTTCNDPLRREYYFQMLSTKISVMNSLHEKIGTVLKPSSTLADSQLVQIATVSSLFSHLRGGAKNDCERNVHKKKHDLLFHHTAGVFDTILLTNTQEIFKELRTKCQNLHDTAVTLGEVLVVYDELNVHEIPEHFKSMWVEYLICFDFDVQKNLFRNSESCLLEDKELEYLLMMSINVAKLYRLKDLIDSYNSMNIEANGNPPHIPSLTMSNIDNIYKGLLILSENIHHQTGRDNGPTFCRGEGERRRVVCTISAFLYHWFSLRFSEFHAEVTQSELLSTITLDPISTNATVEGELNQFKKPNRKKKKRAPLKINNSNSNDNDDEHSHEYVVQNENVSDDAASHDSISYVLDCKSKNMEHLLGDEEEIDESSALSINYDGSVGVTDGDIFISARDFLIARYDEILLSSPNVLHL